MRKSTAKPIAELARLILAKQGLFRPGAYKQLKRKLRKQWNASPRKSKRSVRHAPIVGRDEIRPQLERKILELRQEVRAKLAGGKPS